MIKPNMQIRLEGVIFTAFNLHCIKMGYQNSRDGVRGIIRELPEYQDLMAGDNKNAVDSANQPAT